MTTPTLSAAEIERLRREFLAYAWATHGVKKITHMRLSSGEARVIEAALRTIPALISDADNDRSRYKAQIEGLERERDEARRMLAEADQIVYAFVNKENWSPQKLANAAARHASRLAAAKEKPDGRNVPGLGDW